MVFTDLDYFIKDDKIVKMYKRNILNEISSLALKRHKMAFISGPRQSGKTTLAKMFMKNKNAIYYNWDELNFRKLWTKSPVDTITKKHKLVIFDEIHKASRWKQNLKGVYDTLEENINIIVTGSARLDLYKKGSDSLMGRYMAFRLHPFSIGELLYNRIPDPNRIIDKINNNLGNINNYNINNIWKNLFEYGGFPEPLFSSSKKILKIWQSSRIDKIVREDVRDLSSIVDLSKIKMLISLIPDRVSSPISYTSIKQDIETSYSSVKRWSEYLKQLYYIFEIRPWSKRISRSIKKEAKVYLWDWSEIDDESKKFENMVASHLLKACHYWTDTGEGDFELFYLRTKEKKEIDFLVCKDKKPFIAIETKLNNTSISPNFSYFDKLINLKNYYQLVNKPNILIKKEINKKTLYICSANKFFSFLV